MLPTTRMKKMKLSEKNKILSQVSEVLYQCQSLIQSLSSVHVIDDTQIQSTTVKQMSIKSRSRNSCLELPNVRNSCLVLLNVQSSCQEFAEVPASEDVFTEVSTSEDAFTEVPASEDAFMEVPTSEDKFTDVPASQDEFTDVPASQDEFTEVPASEDVFTDVPASEDEFTEVPASEDEFTEVPASEGVFAKPEDVFTKDIIMKSLEFIDSTFNDLVYNKDWKKINVRQVFDDFSSVCHNALAIFRDPASEVPTPVKLHEVVYPSIDWTRVNTRNLTHLPIPSAQPIHGCSQDPSHYEMKKVQGYNCMEWRPSEFEQNFPFGHLLVSSLTRELLPSLLKSSMAMFGTSRSISGCYMPTSRRRTSETRSLEDEGEGSKVALPSSICFVQPNPCLYSILSAV